METSKTIDVLIVGAGPTGLALAYQLRRLGVSFRIIEKNATPSTTSSSGTTAQGTIVVLYYETVAWRTAHPVRLGGQTSVSATSSK